jgi:hypothetical protein
VASHARSTFSFNQGWRVDQHVRIVRDLNGDGLADVIGFGNDNVYMSLNQGSNGFAPVTVALPIISSMWSGSTTTRCSGIASRQARHHAQLDRRRGCHAAIAAARTESGPR